MSFFQRYHWLVTLPLAGIGLMFSFAPFDLSYLALFALAVAIYSWQARPPKIAFFYGWLFGFGCFMSGLYWVYTSIYDYGGANQIAAIILTILFAAFWAIFPALSAYIVAKTTTRKHIVNQAFWVALVWIVVEYFRGALLLNGFPWLQVGYSQLNSSLSGYIPIIGGYGIGFILTFSAALIAILVHRRKKDYSIFLLIVFLYSAGFGLKDFRWTDSYGKLLTVTLIQGNISQDQKWLPQNRLKILQDYMDLTRQHWDSDIVVWPETAIPAFYHQVEKHFLNPLERMAKENQTDMIVSMPKVVADSNKDFNIILTLGRHRGEYKKNHLLPFGEYMPLQPVSGWILGLANVNINLDNFMPGGFAQPLLYAGGFPFVSTICYEDAFASEILPYLPEAAYLVNVTNDAWFGNSTQPHHHMQIAQMRAKETGRYLVRATNTGLTGIVDDRGRLIKQAPLFERATVTGVIEPMQGMTPFSKIGESNLIILLIGLYLLLSWRSMKRLIANLLLRLMSTK